MNIRPSRFIRLKVVAGYMLMLMLLSYALYYIYEEMQNLQVLEEKQILNSESLTRLIRQKDAQMMDLFHLMKDSSNSESVPAGMLSELLKAPIITTPPPPPPQIIRQVVVEETDSVVKVQPKKSFLKRLAEVFVPGKDSVKHVRTSVTVSSDSMLENTYADPPPVQENFSKIVVNRVQDQIKKKNDFFRDTIAVHQEFIRLRELELTAQIDSILKAYEKEVIARAKLFDQQQKAQRDESIRAIASIAVSAILLVAVFVCIIGRDITRSNRYRRELEVAKQRAEDLLQVREKLMLTITHDFKAPLSSVIGYTEMLQPLLTDEAQQSCLQNIQTSSQHLLKLVSELLDFHRLDMQKEKMNLAPFIPYNLFEEVAAAFLPVAHEKGLELHTKFSEELRTPRLGDALRIRQLIDNLTSNALKFTEKGSITLSAQITNNQLTLSVSDTGRGISHADREKIFRAFTRLPNAQGQEGFGLGLSIVQNITKLLGGTIAVSGKKGAGTTFTVKFLLPKTRGQVPAAHTAQKNKTVAAPVSGSLKGLRIVLIDDDKLQLQLTQSMLTKQGAHVDCCMQVQELIDRLRENHYDYLITDVQMPAISGFDLLKLLRASQLPLAKKIPVIAATAQSNMKCQDFTDLGFVGCLHKPFSLEDLNKLLKKTDASPEKPAPQRTSRVQLKNTRPPVPKPGSPAAGRSSATIASSGTDFEALTAFSDEDEASVRKIRLSFLQETELNISALEKALQEKDAETISRIAHKQLTLFTMIKAGECIPMLIFLEKADSSLFSLRIKNITIKLIEAERNLMEVYKQHYPELA